MLAAPLLALLSLGAPATGDAFVPATMPPGHYGVGWVSVDVPAATPDADGVDKAVPTIVFAPRAGGGDVVRELSPVWAREAAGAAWSRGGLRVIKGPDAPGLYDVSIVLAHGVGHGEAGTPRALGTIEVISPWAYAAGVFALLGALGAALGLAAVRSGRVRLGALVAAVALIALGRHWLLGGHVLFVLLGPVFALLRRGVPRAVFVTRAALAVVLFQEVYWGAIVNGAFWTAPVIACSLLAGLAWVLARVVRRPVALAVLSALLAVFLSGLYVATNIYKAFFLDIPAIAVAGDAGQVGRLLDSVVMVTRVTHLLALALPFVPLLMAAWPVRAAVGPKAQPPAASVG